MSSHTGRGDEKKAYQRLERQLRRQSTSHVSMATLVQIPRMHRNAPRLGGSSVIPASGGGKGDPQDKLASQSSQIIELRVQMTHPASIYNVWGGDQ